MLRRALPICALLACALLTAFAARPSAALEDLTLANLNILHGLRCDPNQCRLSDRIDLLFEWIDDAGCPDVVTLQEVNDGVGSISARDLIQAKLSSACGGQYDGNAVFAGVLGADEEMVLSAEPIKLFEVLELHSGLAPGFTRHVLLVRVEHPAGPVDVFTTHLSSGADKATEPCDIDSNGDLIIDIPCPAACNAAGVTTIRQCQAVQLIDFVNARHRVITPAVVSGDMNAQPGSVEYNLMTFQGWVDTHLAAGNSECNTGTGVGCTSGRASSLSELESTAANVDARIDYAFLVPPPAESQCNATLDGPDDNDGDGTATKIFADDPNPFATCGASPSDICWPSDHEGNELDVALQGCDVDAIPALPLAWLALLAVLLVVTAGFVATRPRRL
jgi:endonuclease/exonuclease/phosphatase family metal-dependent hydrolase